MHMFWYLLMGAVVYVAGVMIYVKQIKPKKLSSARLDFQDKLLRPYLIGCALVMLIVSALLSHYVLGHEGGIDMVYVLINTLVAVGVFYFGLNPDDSNMRLPD